MAAADFTDDWYGWRLRGRHLVLSDGQRITRRLLEGLLWRDAMELRRAGFASRRKVEAERPMRQLVKVVVFQLAKCELTTRPQADVECQLIELLAQAC